jgi:hypothetical protein
VILTNCSFNSSNVGVTLTGNNVSLTNCSFKSSDVGVSLSSANDVILRQCSFIANNIGINSDQSQDIEVFDCSFTANNQGIVLNMPSPSVTASFDVIQSLFDGNGLAVSAQLRQNCKLNVTNNVFKNGPERLNYGTSGVLCSFVRRLYVQRIR